jgi:hypothetical protein
VLYKQNLDYKELFQEYKICYKKANSSIKNIKAIKKTFEIVFKDIINIEIYKIAKNSI